MNSPCRNKRLYTMCLLRRLSLSWFSKSVQWFKYAAKQNKTKKISMSQRSIKASAQVAIVIIIWNRGTLAVWNTTNHEHWHVYEHVSTKYDTLLSLSVSAVDMSFFSLVTYSNLKSWAFSFLGVHLAVHSLNTRVHDKIMCYMICKW